MGNSFIGVLLITANHRFMRNMFSFPTQSVLGTKIFGRLMINGVSCEISTVCNRIWYTDIIMLGIAAAGSPTLSISLSIALSLSLTISIPLSIALTISVPLPIALTRTIPLSIVLTRTVSLSIPLSLTILRTISFCKLAPTHILKLFCHCLQ